MSGTTQGSIKARATIEAKYGKSFYAVQGQKGGRAQVKKGFATNPSLAKTAGAKGGTISRRGPKNTVDKLSVVEPIIYNPKSDILEPVKRSLLDRILRRNK